MRRVITLCFVCAILLLLTGCWDRRETNDLAIVTGVALDKTEEGNIEITVEVHSPGGNKSGGQDGSQGGGSSTILRTGSGVSIPDAIEDLDEKMSREILWSHAEAIVISKAFAETGIVSELDFFVRHPEPRLRSYVFISKGSAKEIVALSPPLERSSSEALIKLAESDVLMRATLLDLMEMLKGESGDAILPMIDILPPEEGQSPRETIAYINRSAILRQGKMIGSIDDKLTRGVMWYRNQIKETIVTVKPEGADGYVSMNLIKGNADLIPEIDGKQLTMTIRIETVDDIIQNQTDLDLNEVESIRKLEDALAQKIEGRLSATLEIVQKEMKADVIGFADEFRRKYPDEWRELKGEWDYRYPTVDVIFDIKAHVLRTGKGGTS